METLTAEAVRGKRKLKVDPMGYLVIMKQDSVWVWLDWVSDDLTTLYKKLRRKKYECKENPYTSEIKLGNERVGLDQFGDQIKQIFQKR